jgi:aspartate aminotransferase-like enzyme
MSYRLYIPGPLTVSDSIVQAMGKPMIGHRSGDFVKLYNDMQPRLQSMFFTQDPVYLATSSAARACSTA